MYSAVWLLHGWCHGKLLPSWCILRTSYNHAQGHVTSCKVTYIGNKQVATDKCYKAKKKENKVLNGMLLLCLWGKHGSHSSSISCRMFVVQIGWSCSGDWQVGILCSALYTGFTLLILPLHVFSLYPCCSHLIIGERSFPCSALSAGGHFPLQNLVIQHTFIFQVLKPLKSLNLFILF